MRYLLAVLLLGCSGGNSSDIHLTMQTTVGAGSEILQCRLVRMPSKASYLIAAEHEYTPGSHHMLLYRTDFTTIDPGMDQVQDCGEGSGSDLMNHVRGVLYGSQEPMGSMKLPDGVGYELASNEILLLQVHYLNASTSDLKSKVTVTLHTTHDPIATKAGVLFFYNPFIDVPAGQMATAAARCTLPADLTIMSVFPHYHARGIGYRAYLDAPGQPPATKPFYTSTDWSHPAPWTGGLMQVAAGTAVRWYCDYDNTMNGVDFYQGPSAATNEMCMFIAGYYPAQDNATELCLDHMNGFGVGNQSCAQALDCIQACPPGDAPATGGAQFQVSDCWQRCFTSTCPSASDLLTDQLNCIGAHCQTECGGTDTTACNTCAQQNCLQQSVACLNSTCG